MYSHNTFLKQRFYFTDPEWKPKITNCTQNGSLIQNDGMSPRVKKVKDAFSIVSITLLTLFIIEVCL